MPASIIRLTALMPAPPTPTTRITARYEATSPATWRRGALAGIGVTKRLAGGAYGSTGSARATSACDSARPGSRDSTTRMGSGWRARRSGLRGLGDGCGLGDRLDEARALGLGCAAAAGTSALSRRPRSRRRARRSRRARSPPSEPCRSVSSGSCVGASAAAARSTAVSLPGDVLGRWLPAAAARPVPAGPPRWRGTAPRAALHACLRACAPSSASFAETISRASSRYASAAAPLGSYLRTELPLTGASA